jgi:RNA recognition motif-containing protein
MGQKIYVGNLGFSVSNQDLKTKFEQYGTVTSANIIMDKDTGRSKGFGFVEMSNSNEATQAIEGLNGSEFSGRQMNVSEAKPQAPRDSRPSGGRPNRY